MHENITKAWELIKESPSMYRRGLEAGEKTGNEIQVRDVRSIIFIGMGGSGVVGDITRDLITAPYTKPLHIVKDYNIPFPVSRDDLVIAVSYSGTTTETLVAAQQAKHQKAMLVFITSGGDMLQLGEEHGIPTVKVSSGLQPRYSAPEMVGAAYGLLSSLGLVKESGRIRNSVNELESFLQSFKSPEMGEPMFIAEKIGDEPVVIYSHSHLLSAGYRFKAQLNENSKHPAYTVVLPEAGHNEVEAWFRDFKMVNIVLRSRWEAPVIAEMINWMVDEMNRRKIRNHVIKVEASSHQSEIMKIIALTDLATVSLAKRKDVDPLKLSILPEVRKAVKTNAKLKEHILREF